jgi:hypothetical protein
MVVLGGATIQLQRFWGVNSMSLWLMGPWGSLIFIPPFQRGGGGFAFLARSHLDPGGWSGLHSSFLCIQEKWSGKLQSSQGR